MDPAPSLDIPNDRRRVGHLRQQTVRRGTAPSSLRAGSRARRGGTGVIAMNRLHGLATLLRAGWALIAGGPVRAGARQATREAPPLAALGLPGFTIPATAGGFAAPAAVAAGWYLV